MQIDLNSNEAELNEQPGANLVECRLTCEERLNLAKKTLQLMEVQQKGDLDQAQRAPYQNEQMTGALGV